MSINEAQQQPDLPIGVTVVRKHVWDNFNPPIVILELSDGSLTVNGGKVEGRPEYDGQPPPTPSTDRSEIP